MYFFVIVFKNILHFLKPNFILLYHKIKDVLKAYIKE